MSADILFDFTRRAIIPLARDYQNGESEPWHTHACAQLLHTLTGVVRVETEQGYWIIPPSRGVWLPSGTRHRLKVTGHVAARILFVDPLARADLPGVCQVVQVSDLLRALIVRSLTLPVTYTLSSHEERVYELILDEIRGMPVLPLNLPDPQSEKLQQLCQQIRHDPSADWSSARGALEMGISERTLVRHFRQQTGIAFSEWVRRARLITAIERLALGHAVLRVALDLGYDSHSAFSAMFRRTLGVSPSDYFTD